MKVVVELDTWQELFRNSWSGALDNLREIEAQGREKEALAILEVLFRPSIWGRIPTKTEVNDYIWFDLADVMDLYGDDEEDEDAEEAEDDEEDEDDE